MSFIGHSSTQMLGRILRSFNSLMEIYSLVTDIKKTITKNFRVSQKNILIKSAESIFNCCVRDCTFSPGFTVQNHKVWYIHLYSFSPYHITPTHTHDTHKHIYVSQFIFFLILIYKLLRSYLGYYIFVCISV